MYLVVNEKNEKLEVNWSLINKNSTFNNIDKLYFLIQQNIIPKSIGTLKTHPKQNNLSAPPFILTLEETLYLKLKECLEISSTFVTYYCYELISNDLSKIESSLFIYFDLIKRDYFIQNGIKYGSKYLVYSEDPNLVHSKYLVMCYYSHEKFKLIQAQRLARNTKKDLLIGIVKINKEELIDFDSFSKAKENEKNTLLNNKIDDFKQDCIINYLRYLLMENDKIVEINYIKVLWDDIK